MYNFYQMYDAYAYYIDFLDISKINLENCIARKSYSDAFFFFNRKINFLER